MKTAIIRLNRKFRDCFARLDMDLVHFASSFNPAILQIISNQELIVLLKGFFAIDLFKELYETVDNKYIVVLIVNIFTKFQNYFKNIF